MRRLLQRSASEYLGTSRHGQASPEFMQGLEPRVVMSNSPLPTLGDLERPENPVVRFEINAGPLRGDVDIELFGDVAPITVANFLNYVTSGRYDNSFFHRVTTNATDGLAVLQGGAFVYDDDFGFKVSPTDAPISRENTGRAMTERTIAMARLGGATGLNTATDQFFFNMTANPAIDTPGDNQFFAFGRVIQGWGLMQQLGSLAGTNLSTQPAFSGNSSASALTTVPASSSHSAAAGAREAGLVIITNAEIIKPANVTGYYTGTAIYPEGQASEPAFFPVPGFNRPIDPNGIPAGSVGESVSIFNPNSAPATVQVIVHYERRSANDQQVRDSVLTTLTLGAGSNTTFDPSMNPAPYLRTSTPYSLEIQFAVPAGTPNVRPLAASSSRINFDCAAASSFFDPKSVSDADKLVWDIPRLERNALSREFVLWQNLSDLDATVSVTFTATDGTTTTIVRTTEPYRRNGLGVADLGLNDGTYSVHVTSTQPVVVSFSDYDIASPSAPALTVLNTPGWSDLASPGGGAVRGGIASAVLSNNVTSTLSFMNPGGTSATITINFWRDTRASGALPVQRSLTVPATSRKDFVLDSTSLGIPLDERLSVTYVSTTVVTAQYTEFDSANRNFATVKRHDGDSVLFQKSVGAEWCFTGVTVSPTASATATPRILSIFNTFNDPAFVFSYTVIFRYEDGSTLSGPSGSLAANQRLDYNIANDAGVRLKALTTPLVPMFAVVVTGSSNSIPAGGLVSLERVGIEGYRTISSPFAFAPGLPFGDPAFGPALAGT